MTSCTGFSGGSAMTLAFGPRALRAIDRYRLRVRSPTRAQGSKSSAISQVTGTRVPALIMLETTNSAPGFVSRKEAELDVIWAGFGQSAQRSTLQSAVTTPGTCEAQELHIAREGVQQGVLSFRKFRAVHSVDARHPGGPCPVSPRNLPERGLAQSGT